jgi:hypothetical protein
VTVRGYQLAVDWSTNGTYTGTLEDVSSYVLPGDVEISYGRDVSGEVTLTAPSATMGFELTNEQQLFSPENVSSPIVGKILPGRRVRFQVTNLGVTYTLLAGVLDKYDVEADPVGVFSGTVLDGWGRPGSKKLSTDLYRGIRTGDAVNIVLDQIGWTGGRDIDAGATVMPWWWEEGTDAATAIDKLVHSEGTPAIAYVEGGVFSFKDRHHRLFDQRSTTSQGTYTHVVPAGTGPVGDNKIEAGTFAYNHGAARIVNSATFSVDVRGSQPLGEVWTSEDPLTIATGQTVTIVAQPSEPFHSAITPSVAAGDVQVQSGTISSVTLSRTSGQSAVLTITASADAVITRLALRAVGVAVVRTVQVSAADPGSIGTFGTQEWPSDAAPVWANQYDAQVIATRVVTIYASYRPTITFSVPLLTANDLAVALNQKISDRITVRNDKRGINGDFVIERLTHRITSMGLIHRLEITCQAVEPTQPANVFRFNTSGAGFDQGRFGADGIDDAGTMFRFDVAGAGFDQGRWAN